MHIVVESKVESFHDLVLVNQCHDYLLELFESLEHVQAELECWFIESLIR